MSGAECPLRPGRAAHARLRARGLGGYRGRGCKHSFQRRPRSRRDGGRFATHAHAHVLTHEKRKRSAAHYSGTKLHGIRVTGTYFTEWLGLLLPFQICMLGIGYKHDVCNRNFRSQNEAKYVTIFTMKFL